MLSVADWSAMLRAAREHLAEVEALVAALAPLASAEAPGWPAKAPGRPLGRAAGSAKATGRPPGRPPGRTPGRAEAAAAGVHAAGYGPAAIHAAASRNGSAGGFHPDMLASQAIRAVLAQYGPATARQVAERLTAAGWRPTVTKRQRQHGIDVAASAMRGAGILRAIGATVGGAGRPGTVYALAEAPAQASAKLAAAAARLGADEAAPARQQPAPVPAGRQAHYGRPRRNDGIRLKDRVARVLAASAEPLTVRQLTDRLAADGWRTDSTQPENVIRDAIGKIRAALVVNRAGPHITYALRAAKAKAPKAKAKAPKAKAVAAQAHPPAAGVTRSVPETDKPTTEH